MLKNALQCDADLMRRLTELYRRTNPHVHAHDLALNRNVRMFVRESEFELRSGQQETARFNVATAEAQIGDDAQDRAFLALFRNFRGEPAPHPRIQTADLHRPLVLLLQLHPLPALAT